METRHPSSARTRRDIALLVFPGFQIQDLSGPLAAFEIAGNCLSGEPYRCYVVSASGGAVASSSGLEVLTASIREDAYDTLIVVGGTLQPTAADIHAVSDPIIQAASSTARRIASVCTGAFLLASAGLLDGKRATTHWKHTAHLQRQFPGINVERDTIFTKDGRIWTSAGITAGIDLALAMIEEDLGPAVSKATARTLVVYHRRPGGQSQFSALNDMEPESDRIRTVLTYMREHLGESLSTERLAAIACLSIRQFGRAFLAATGETPARAVERLRVEVARPRVERGVEPIEVIARSVGFADPERMRRAFIRVIGHAPQSVRRIAASQTTSAATH